VMLPEEELEEEKEVFEGAFVMNLSSGDDKGGVGLLMRIPELIVGRIRR